MPEHAPTPETLRLLNDEVSARAARLDANTARLDTKATTMLGFILAACTFLATQPIGGWWKVPVYGVFVAAATLGFQSMRPRKFKDAPQPDAVLQFLAQRPETVALTLILEAKAQAFKENQMTHERKANSWRWCLATFTLAVVFMVSVLILGGQHRLATPASVGPRDLLSYPTPRPMTRQLPSRRAHRHNPEDAMVDEANDAQTGILQPEPQVQAEPQPSDEQIIQALIGTETKGDASVTNLVNKLMGANEFSRRRDGNEIET